MCGNQPNNKYIVKIAFFYLSTCKCGRIFGYTRMTLIYHVYFAIS